MLQRNKGRAAFVSVDADEFLHSPSGRFRLSGREREHPQHKTATFPSLPLRPSHFGRVKNAAQFLLGSEGQTAPPNHDRDSRRSSVSAFGPVKRFWACTSPVVSVLFSGFCFWFGLGNLRPVTVVLVLTIVSLIPLRHLHIFWTGPVEMFLM